MPNHDDPYTRPELDPNLFTLDGEHLSFFKQQTGLGDEQKLKSHILDVQNEAYQIYGYPCIRNFSFLSLKIAKLDGYQKALKLLHERSRPLLLDIGCCFGNDLRTAAADGWPMNDMVGSDLREGFWECGHKLFRSTPETFPVQFLAGDIFDEHFLATRPTESQLVGQGPIDLNSVASLNNVRGRLSAIHASSFFHLFSEDQQLDLAHRLASLLLPVRGSIIFGQHISHPETGKHLQSEMILNAREGASMFCHSPETWRDMWESQVLRGIGLDVEVDVQLVPIERQETSQSMSSWLMRWSVALV